MNTPEIPLAGTPAYWTAQREAFALVRAWQLTINEPGEELVLLRRIAAHPFAARVMAAHGHPVGRWIAILDTMGALFEATANDDADVEGPQAPPHGDDWCPRGCQPLFGMECGMCGYDGPGVWASQTDTVAEYCCRCRARTYQDRDGMCEICGQEAEGVEDAHTPASLPAGRPSGSDERQHRPGAPGQARSGVAGLCCRAGAGAEPRSTGGTAMTADPKKASGVTLRTVAAAIAVVTAPVWVFLLAFAALPAVLAVSGDPRIVTFAGTVVPPWAAHLPGILLWTAAVAIVARRVQ